MSFKPIVIYFNTSKAPMACWFTTYRRSLRKYFICDFCPRIFNEILQILRIFHELMHLFRLLCVERKLNTQKQNLVL
jgi:hypothetical protein